MKTALRRPAGLVVFPLLVAASGCVDHFFHEAAPGPARVAVAFRQAGGAADAFDAADNLAVEIRAGGETLVATTVGVSAAGGNIETRLDVDLPDGAVTAQLSVELRRGSDDLFTGEGSVGLTPGETTQATLDLAPVVAGLDLTPPPTFTVYGQARDLEGVALFATGDEVPGTDVTWTSLDPGIVSVEPTSGGGWRAVAIADGTTSLRGTAGGRTATVGAQVRATVVSIDVVPPSLDLFVGESASLSAVLLDAGGSVIPGRSPAWASSDVGVATVASDGTVAALAPGSADVSATADGVSGRSTVRVRPPGPDVTTLPPSGVTAGSATLRARIDPRGSTTSVVFEYGTDPDLTQAATTAPQAVSGTAGPVEVSRTVSGLSPATTWYARAIATNASGTTEGEIVSFTTASVPAVPTSLAGQFTGGVLLTWLDNSSTETRFEIERELVQGSPGFTSGADGPLRAFQPVATVGADVTQFEDTSPPAGELRYRVRACNDGGCSDWTPPLTWFYGLPPLVQTRPASNVGTDQAVLSAFVNPQNAPSFVYWQLASDPAFTSPTSVPKSALYAGEGNVDVIQSHLATLLQPGSRHYVRAVAFNTWGATFGNVETFVTAGGG